MAQQNARLGGKLRRLRQSQKLTQAQMAEALGLSASYLNLLEHNQRAVTVPVLLKLAQRFGIDIADFTADDDARLTSDLMEVFADPLFDGADVVPISPSRLEAIERSPLDWFLETIAPRESGPQTGIGTIVHAAMQHATDPDLDAIWAAIEQRWSELVFESPWLAEQQRRLARRYAVGVAAYLRDAESEGRGLVGAEERFELIVDRARVSGSVDRLEVDADGAVRVVDLKTGAPLTKQAEIDAHPQLAAYQLAYAEGAFDEVLDRVLDGLPHTPGGARLLYVREGVKGSDYREAVQAPLDEAQREAVRERLRQAVAAVAVARLTGVRTVDRFDFAAAAHRIHRIGPVTGEG